MQLTHETTNLENRTFPITIVCDHIYFQQNIGSIFRIADAFGVQEILFLGKDIPLTPRKINKTSRSTHLHIPHRIYETSKGLILDLKAANFKVISLELTKNSLPIARMEVKSEDKIALILGSEIDGVSPELLEISDQVVHIPMYGKNSSMNVVQAASICLYELTNRL